MMRLRAFLLGFATALVTAVSSLQAVSAQPYGYPGPYGPPGYRQPYPPPQQQNPAPPQQSPAAQQQTPEAQEMAAVRILAPQDGANLSQSDSLVLEYTVDPGPQGDHVHVYVDDREVAILRALEGHYRVGRLDPGSHQVAIKVVNRAHVPIGVEESITVNVR